MSNLKTLVLLSLVAGLTAPVMATEKTNAELKAAYEAGVINPLIDNTCATAVPVPLGTTTVTGDGVTNLQLWYYWVGTGSGLHLETCTGSTNFDTDIRIYTGTCPSLTQVYYNDGPSACSYHTNLQCAAFTFAVGQTYYIRIDRFSNANILAGQMVTMLWEDCAPPPPPPANNEWTGASPIAVGGCVTGDTSAPYTDTTGGYADVTHLLCPWINFYSSTSSGAGRDAWFQVTVPAGMYSFDLAGSTYDTVIGVWDANHMLIAGNDDFTGLQSKVECCQLPAGTYYISVDGYGANTGGAFQLCVTGCAPVDANDQPVAFSLSQNVPNPFNPTTTIAYSMPETGTASLKVFDVAGHTVATLVDGMVDRGQHTVNFDASNLSSGVYFYTLQAGATVETKKMVLMK